MLRSMQELKGFSITATDGEIGSVEDFYFDDNDWTVRYIVVETGGWLTGRKVLLSPLAVHGADWASRQIFANLTRNQVRDSPSYDAAKPVSRQFEVNYFNYYSWPYYWVGPYTWGYWPYPAAAAMAAVPERAESPVSTKERGDSHLRSVKEVTGYHIQATDDEIGHVEDFIVDDESWQIRYLAVDTSNWWFGKKVLLAPRWIERVNWPDQLVHVDLRKEQIKGSPEWNPEAPINRDYEARLYDYYGRPVYWR